MLLRRQQPSRQAGAQVGEGEVGGLCMAVRTTAKQLFAGHPDGVCSQRSTLVGALKPAPFILAQCYFSEESVVLHTCSLCLTHVFTSTVQTRTKDKIPLLYADLDIYF